MESKTNFSRRPTGCQEPGLLSVDVGCNLKQLLWIDLTNPDPPPHILRQIYALNTGTLAIISFSVTFYCLAITYSLQSITIINAFPCI